MAPEDAACKLHLFPIQTGSSADNYLWRYEVALHVFVAMPYGIKEKLNFDKIYIDFIKPALEEEGFEVFRADEEVSAGNIRTDMF